MLGLDNSQRKFRHNLTLAIALSAVAGAVNATGFFVVGTYTSHVTGNVARVGDEFAQQHMDRVWEAAALVGFFFLGAVTAAALTEIAKEYGRARFVIVLLVEAMILASFIALTLHFPTPTHAEKLSLTGMLCFAMGIQNALVTNISGAVIRTTHLTGIVTDFGIEVVRLFSHQRKLLGRHMHPKAFNRFAFLREPELHKAMMHISIFMSFLLGGVAGPLLYFEFGVLSLAAPCLVLILLTVFDYLVSKKILSFNRHDGPQPPTSRPLS